MSFICASFKIFGIGVASGRNAGLELCGHWPQLLGQFGGRVSSQVVGSKAAVSVFPLLALCLVPRTEACIPGLLGF